jgi:hypothetical protein
MTSPLHAPATAPAAAAQLWIRAGDWRIRADQVIAVGHSTRNPAQSEAVYVVKVATASSRGHDGDTEPATYALAQFTSEEQARYVVGRVVELMGAWGSGYGTLSVTGRGHVRLSRPRAAGTSPAGEAVITRTTAAESDG